MKTVTLKTFLSCLIGIVCLKTLAVEPSVSQVTVRQRWPWSRLVDIDYVLNADPDTAYDIQVQAFNGAQHLEIPANAFSGHLYNVSEGARRIVFDPVKTAYTNSEIMTQFKVSLTPSEIPLYMIVDLEKNAGDAGQIEYIYPGDARLITDGRFTNVWFDVTNDAVYATQKLVLRRITSGNYGMGETCSLPVTLTKDLYVSIFMVTSVQWLKVVGSTTSTSTLPRTYNLSYEAIRGATNDTPSVNWPSTASFVNPTSFLGLLRDKTGMYDFDLPTEAQWEYICRAGTTSYFNDGASTSANDTNILKRLAWYVGNSGGAGALAVGQKEANQWGIYDTHGNLWEWCRDWFGALQENSIDPTGPLTGSRRVLRGGGWCSSAESCRSASRNGNYAPSATGTEFGFRLVRELP